MFNNIPDYNEVLPHEMNTDMALHDNQQPIKSFFLNEPAEKEDYHP